VTAENNLEHYVYEHPLLTKLNNIAMNMHINAGLAERRRTRPVLIYAAMKKRADPVWEAIHQAKAGWRRALMSQPPIVDVYSDGGGESHLIARNKSGLVMEDVIPMVHSKGARFFNFNKPALKLRGYNRIACYEGYGQLEDLLLAEKSKKLEG
jgi:hypothetical protein